MTQILLRDAVQSDDVAVSTGQLWNTGNYFFLDAVERQLQFDKVVYRVQDLTEADTLVLSMSNFISPTTDMSAFADAIENNGYEHVVMIGAGAQAENFDDRIELSPGTLRFLKLLSERSHSIGVRGFYTADILEDHGIHNTWVIGCPTLFWHMNPRFRIDAAPTPAATARYSVNSTPNGKYRDKLALLYGAAVEADAQYIGQTENFLPLFGESALPSRDFFSRFYCDEGIDPERLSELAARAVHFTDIPGWIDYMGRFDFAVGSRFHGNMAALQAGVPALSLVTDSRTKELCDFLNLPSIALNQCSDLDFRRLYGTARFDLFNATFRIKYHNYVDFLEHNGLAHRLPPSGLREHSRPDRHRGDGKQRNYDLSALRTLLHDVHRAGFDNAEESAVYAASLLSELRTAVVGNAVEKGDFSLQRLKTSGRESVALARLLQAAQSGQA